MVLMVMIIMFILSAAAYQVSQGNIGLIAIASSNEKALYAAEQGYNKCLWRLNNEDGSFFKDIDPSPEKVTYDSKSYNMYELPDGPNYRLRILVPLEDVPGLNTQEENNNQRIIRCTGWDTSEPDRLRTIEVEVYKRTFTQFAIANDSERSEGGDPLYWLTGEAVYGPLHTNDTLFVSGTPTFYGPVTYVNGINISPAENMYNPSIFRKGNERVSEKMSFPPSNPELKAHARINGHYYNGRTCIYLREDGGYDARYYDQTTGRWYYNGVEYAFIPTRDGNPPAFLGLNCWKASEIRDEKAEGSNDKMFRKIVRDSSGNIIEAQSPYYRSFADLRNSIGHLELPANGVIYVDGATGSGNTGGLSSERKFDISLGNVFVSGKLDGRLTIAAANNIYITAHDPCDWQRPPDYTSSWYDAKPGVTYSSTDFQQVFENGEWSYTKVLGEGDDMLGLVADYKVQVMHYNWPSGYHDVRYTGSVTGLFDFDNYCWSFLNLGVPIDKAPDDIYLYAAIYAKEQYFGFEAYDNGRVKDTAYLVGSIAQKYRGPMGVQYFDGYKKNYSHDPRLLYDSPPMFPDPANSGWRSSRWDEITNHIE